MILTCRAVLIFLMSLLFAHPLVAQIQEPVTFDFEFIQVEKDIFDLRCTMSVDSGWWVLARGNDPSITSQFDMWLEDATDIVAQGDFKELPPSSTWMKYGPYTMKVYKKKAVFVQRIKMRLPRVRFTCVTSYFACDEYKCLPPVDLRHDIVAP